MTGALLLAWVALALAGDAAVPAAGLDPQQVVGSPAVAPLEGEAMRAEARRISMDLRCPTCQGMSVAESPAEGARAMRTEVERLVAQGYDEAQIKDYFVAAYGEFILLDPRKSGANLALWVVPAALALGGLGLVVSNLRRRRGGGAPLPPPSPPVADPGPPADDYRTRAEKEIDP